MFRKTISILITIIFTSIFSIVVHAESNLTTKLKENLIPFKTVEAGNGFEDLMPLKEILKDKKVIGMGEATHGTKEFFQMKHRMFEFLVEEMGYRVFAIEASFGGAQVVNDYILNGMGSIDEAMAALEYWTWHTEEVVDMIEWMRNYNESSDNKDKIKFYGFDMQSINYTLNDILGDLHKFDYRRYKEFTENLSKIDPMSFYAPSPGDLLIIEKDILEIKSLYEENRDNYINKKSQKEFDLMIKNFDIILQWIEFNQISIEEDFNRGFNIRDKYMAENVKWMLNFETQHYGNDKIMLWAHNLHVSKNNYTLKDQDEFRIFGSNLDNLFKDEYYSIGFDFYKGSFRAIPGSPIKRNVTYDVANFTIDKSSKETFAYQLQETGVELGYLDFNNAIKDDGLDRLLSRETLMCNIGSGYAGRYLQSYSFLDLAPIEIYDALIFVKTTESAVGIGNGRTKIEDGDKYLSQFYKKYFLMIGFSIAIIFCVIIFIVKRIKKRKIIKIG